MKPILILSILALSAASYTGCKKSEGAKPQTSPAPTSNVMPGATVNNSIIQSQLVYPYTDTFTGPLSVTYGENAPYYYDSMDATYQFIVTHVSKDRVIVTGTRGINLEQWWTSTIYICDTVDLSPASIYTMPMKLFVHNNNQIIEKNGLSISFDGGHLYLAWDIGYVPMIGSCDYSESKGYFTGVSSKH